jgi:hypothetical protein
MVMGRKQAYVSADQQQKLRRIAPRRGCAEAEVVRVAIERSPEYDDPITRRLVKAGILAPPPDDDGLLSEEEADQLERDLQACQADQTEPLGLSRVVIEDREGR